MRLARRAFLRDVDADTVVTPRSPSDRRRTRLIASWARATPPIAGRRMQTIGAFDEHSTAATGSGSLARCSTRAVAGCRASSWTFDPDPPPGCFCPSPAIASNLLNNEDRSRPPHETSVPTSFSSVPFTRSLAANSTESFLRSVVSPVFKPRANLHVGSDFKLGAGNAGNVEELRKLGTRRLGQVRGVRLRPRVRTLQRSRVSGRAGCAVCSWRTGTVRQPLAGFFCRPAFCARRRQRRDAQRGSPSAPVPRHRRPTTPTWYRRKGSTPALSSSTTSTARLADGRRTWGCRAPLPTSRAARRSRRICSVSRATSYRRQVSVAFVERLRGQQAFESLDDLMATVNSKHRVDRRAPGGLPRASACSGPRWSLQRQAPLFAKGVRVFTPVTRAEDARRPNLGPACRRDRGAAPAR